MLSRRALLVSTLAAAAVRPATLSAQTAPPPGSGESSSPATILQLQSRTIEVNGKPASVFAIRQPDGTAGIVTEVGKRFRVHLENNIDQPSLIHWHGLTPPWQQDGVPGISGPPIAPGGNADYDFPLRFGGTFWMHSHQGLQEQSLMLAPLIIHDGRDRPGEQEIVLTLNDFSFTPADEIFAGLKKSGSTLKMASAAAPMVGMARAAGPDLNDVKYDAFLANDRTLADPEVIKVEPGGHVLLRIINGSSMSNYHVDLGQLKGELIAVDADCTGDRKPLPDRGRAAARHPAHASPRTCGPSVARGAGRRPAPDRHRAGRRRRGNSPHPRHDRHGFAPPRGGADIRAILQVPGYLRKKGPSSPRCPPREGHRAAVGAGRRRRIAIMDPSQSIDPQRPIELVVAHLAYRDQRRDRRSVSRQPARHASQYFAARNLTE
jgi:hypothetical protein